MTSANSSAEIAEMFRLHKQAYPMTDSGNPSFVKDWLKNNPFEGAQLVYNIRRLAKVESTFLRGMLIDGASNGKLYPSLHPLRGESGGAVSGRFSCSKPNSQQIPSRDDELAPIIRGMFKPEEGKQWLKLDYSQIEYRFFAHYSNDEMLMEAYKDPDADFHDLVGKMLGGTLPRTPIKNFNFGLLYGMGKDKLKRMLSEHNLPMSSEAFFKLYHEKFPAAKRVSQECTDEATKTGEIRTILNRRNTFNLWEPVDYAAPALPFGHAVKAYGGKIRRAFTHKALNRRLQGSSADLLKKAMVTLHEDGTYARVGYPYITVHDELDHGYHADLHEDFQHIKEVMETAIPLRVPVRVDAELGPDWGHLEDFDL
jgi:DNA polymerase I-like protein with 3'-5' exonuclease and polymerase domains